MLKKGQAVQVKPHTIYQNLSVGAVVNPPREIEHKGYARAVITAIFKDGSVEVKVGNRGYDIVRPDAIEVL